MRTFVGESLRAPILCNSKKIKKYTITTYCKVLGHYFHDEYQQITNTYVWRGRWHDLLCGATCQLTVGPIWFHL